jgi:GAF domain-containing protein
MSLCDPKTKDNLIMKSILIKEPIVIHNFLDASHGVITDRLARILQRVVGLKSSINIPVILNNHVIASIFFSKNYIDDFTAELPVLKAFCEHVGQSIINARKYEDLKKKLEEYYNAK